MSTTVSERCPNCEAGSGEEVSRMTDLDLAAIRGRVERARESVRGVNLPEREIAWADLRSHAAEDTWRLLGEVDRLSAEQDERIQAWEAIAAHAAFADCYQEERPLLESVIDRIDALVSTSEAVVELAPSSLQAEIDRLNATIQRVRDIVNDKYLDAGQMDVMLHRALEGGDS